jgi:hypothetical protein
MCNRSDRKGWKSRLMRLALMAAISAMAALSAYARNAENKPLPRVLAYVDNGAVPPRVLHLAEGIADGMFATAGVRIDWQGHSHEGSRMPGGALAIGLLVNKPANFLPGALAFARVYEGVHIDVFCDRLERLAPGARMEAPLLAHVLVHEITHMLEGIDRHSGTGVMKAHWNARDYADMATNPLPFAPVDITLIQLGLAARTRGQTLVAADSVAAAQDAQ